MAAIRDERDRRAVISAPPRTTVGHPIGIIAIRLDYPKLPGNVVNADTFDYPVLYEEVVFEIERLFAGDPSLLQRVAWRRRASPRLQVPAVSSRTSSRMWLTP